MKKSTNILNIYFLLIICLSTILAIFDSLQATVLSFSFFSIVFFTLFGSIFLVVKRRKFEFSFKQLILLFLPVIFSLATVLINFLLRPMFPTSNQPYLVDNQWIFGIFQQYHYYLKDEASTFYNSYVQINAFWIPSIVLWASHFLVTRRHQQVGDVEEVRSLVLPLFYAVLLAFIIHDTIQMNLIPVLALLVSNLLITGFFFVSYLYFDRKKERLLTVFTLFFLSLYAFQLLESVIGFFTSSVLQMTIFTGIPVFYQFDHQLPYFYVVFLGIFAWYFIARHFQKKPITR